MAEGKMCGNCCNSGDMMGHLGNKNRYKLLKFVVILILMFMAFYIGVQFGEIKGGLGLGSHGKYQKMMRTNYMDKQPMMYGAENIAPGAMQ